MLKLKSIADVKYHDGVSIMNDEEYDVLDDLVRREYNNIPDVCAKKGSVKLPVKMWSLNKKKIIDEKQNGRECIIMDKLDGVSCLIHDGRAYTRGNGIQGTDITELIMPNVFSEALDKNVAIRGELVVPKNELNCVFKNTRSMVCSCVAKKQNSESLMFVAYEIIYMDKEEDFDIETQLGMLQSMNIKCVWYIKAEISQQLLESILSERKKSSDFDIDGLVVSYTKCERKVKNLKRNPTYSFSFKKNSLSGVKTKVLDIIWSCGKTQVFYPTLKVEPIDIGCKISSVTGHNYSFLKKNRIGVGSIVEIIKAGEIIPHILNVISNSDEMKIPENSVIENDKLKCIDKVKILTAQMLHFFKSIGMKGIGLKTCEKVALKFPDYTLLELVSNKFFNFFNDSVILKIRQCISKCPKEILFHGIGYFGDIPLKNIKFSLSNSELSSCAIYDQIIKEWTV